MHLRLIFFFLAIKLKSLKDSFKMKKNVLITNIKIIV